MSAPWAASPACRLRCPGLAALGVTAVELIADQRFSRPAQLGLRRRPAVAPDRSYGTPEELKALVDAAMAWGA